MKRVEEIGNIIYKKYITNQFKIAFMSTVIIGLIAHMYMLTNKLPNYDDINNINGFGATLRLGRWFLWLLGAISYHLNFVFSLPWFNGFLSILLIAISSGLIVEILKVEGKISCVLIGGLLIVFPAWTGIFFFMFTVVYYAIALLLGVFAIYCVRDNFKYWYVSIACLIFSLGIYQAFLPTFGSIMVIKLLIDTYDQKQKAKYIFLAAVRWFGILLSGVVGYIVVAILSLKITGQEFASYKNMDTIGDVSTALNLGALQQIVINIIQLIIPNRSEMSYNLLLNIAFLGTFISILILTCFHTIKLYKEKNPHKIGLVLLFTILAVVAMNGIYLMGVSHEGIYSIMYHGIVFFFVLPTVLMEKEMKFHCVCEKYIMKHMQIMMEYIVVLIGIVTIFSYCHFANGQYMSMDLSVRQAESYFTTMISNIKGVKGYSDKIPVVFIGNDIVDLSFYQNDIMDSFLISGRDKSLENTFARDKFLQQYCGFNQAIERFEDEQYTKEITSMPCYPIDGSIQVVDNKIIVKLNELEEK